MRAFSAERWLSENVWEGEDGPSAVEVVMRAYYWDTGACWVDERTVAVEGLGEDKNCIVAGARVFDVERVAEVATFAGPSGTFFSDGARLFSAGEDGLSVWDVVTGERLGRVDGFRPSHHDRARGVLVEARPASVVVWG
jgi:hypothetical protein